MNYEKLEEINYENLDDLPLAEHIEWNHQGKSELGLSTAMINAHEASLNFSTCSENDFIINVDNIVKALCF